MSQSDHKQIPEEKAKQGLRGNRVLIVLVAALILAAVAWAVAEIYGEAIDEEAEQTTSVLLQPSFQAAGTSTFSALG